MLFGELIAQHHVLATRLLRMYLNTAFPEQRIAGLRPAYYKRRIPGLPPALTEQRNLCRGCQPTVLLAYLAAAVTAAPAPADAHYKFGRTSHCRVEV